MNSCLKLLPPARNSNHIFNRIINKIPMIEVRIKNFFNYLQMQGEKLEIAIKFIAWSCWRCSASHVTLPTFISRLKKKHTGKIIMIILHNIYGQWWQRGEKKFAKIIPASWDIYHLVDINYSFSYGFLSVVVIVFDSRCILRAQRLSISLLRLSVYLFLYASISWYGEKKSEKKINHVINFDISACERCEIQQWPNTICLLRDLVCWERINWRPTHTYCKQRTAINEWVEKKPTVTD